MPAVIAGREAGFPLEKRGEMVLVGEFERGGDLLDRPGGGAQEFAGGGDLAPDQVLRRSFSEIPFENTDRLNFGTRGKRGKFIQRRRFPEHAPVEMAAQTVSGFGDNRLRLRDGEIGNDGGHDGHQELRSESGMRLFRMLPQPVQQFPEKFGPGEAGHHHHLAQTVQFLQLGHERAGKIDPVFDPRIPRIRIIAVIRSRVDEVEVTGGRMGDDALGFIRSGAAFDIFQNPERPGTGRAIR